MAVSTLRLDEEQKRVIRHLRTHGPMSRTALAAELQVSGAKLTKLSRGLLTLDLIEEVHGPDAQGRGRPAVPLRISATGGYAVGTTAHKGVLEIALVDYAGGIIALSDEQFDGSDPKLFAGKVRRRMHELADRHNLLGARLLGVGLGVPGPSLSRDGDRWSVVDSLPGWRDMPLRQIMDNALGLPIWIENDASAAALAEYYLGGLLQTCSTAVVILLGHGIGAGIIVDGRLMRGEFGNAGEIGCLYPADQPRPSTLDLLAVLRADGCDISSIADFEARTRGHDETIRRWVVRAAQQLEIAVSSAFAWFDPGEIIISGPLPPALLARLAECLNRGKLIGGEHRTRAPEVRISNLGGASTTLGAALLPIHASTALG